MEHVVTLGETGQAPRRARSRSRDTRSGSRSRCTRRSGRSGSRAAAIRCPPAAGTPSRTCRSRRTAPRLSCTRSSCCSGRPASTVPTTRRFSASCGQILAGRDAALVRLARHVHVGRTEHAVAALGEVVHRLHGREAQHAGGAAQVAGRALERVDLEDGVRRRPLDQQPGGRRRASTKPTTRNERSMNWRRVLGSLMRALLRPGRRGGRNTWIRRRTGSAARIRPCESTARWMCVHIGIEVLGADDRQQAAVGLEHLHARNHLLGGDDLAVRRRGEIDRVAAPHEVRRVASCRTCRTGRPEPRRASRRSPGGGRCRWRARHPRHRRSHRAFRSAA